MADLHPETNAELHDKPNTSLKRDSSSKPSFIAKKRRFNKPSTKPSFTSKSIPKSIALSPIKRFFTLHTSTFYLNIFFSSIYNVIITRDSKFSATSVERFNYVCHLAFYYRLYHLGEQLAYSFSSRTSKLKRYAEALLLPEAVCRLIESIGCVKLINGTTVVPYIPSNDEYKNSGFYMTMEQLATNIDNLERENFNSALSADLILQYMASTTRGFKANMLFRKCMFDNLEGTIESTVAVASSGSDMRAYSVQEMEEAIALVGGSYSFRTLEDKPRWFGDEAHFSYSFSSATFDPVIQISSKIVNELNK